MSEWISVEDHLPDDENDFRPCLCYLVTWRDSNGDTGVWWAEYDEDNQAWMWDDYLDDDEVTHWMHMPEPAGDDRLNLEKCKTCFWYDTESYGVSGCLAGEEARDCCRGNNMCEWEDKAQRKRCIL